MDEILKKIRDFADEAHGEQLRKYTPERYIVHPVRVMETCREYDQRLPILAAALLHDVIEDTDTGEKAILSFLKTIMGPSDAERTVSLVIELSDVYVKSAFPKMNRKARKDKELERVALTSAAAQTIKYADLIDNTKEIALHDPGFAPRYLAECMAILKRADKGNKELRSRAVGVVKKGSEELRSPRRR